MTTFVRCTTRQQSKNMKQRLLSLVVLACTIFVCSARPAVDEQESRLRMNISEAQARNDEKGFYEASDNYLHYLLTKKKWEQYYEAWLDRITYNINQNHYFRSYADIKQMSQDIKEHHEEKYQYLAYIALGRYYNNQGNFELSEQHYRSALELTDSLTKPHLCVNLHLALADVASNTNRQRALDYLNHMEDMPKTLRQQASIFAQRCLIYDKMGRWDDFEASFQKYDSLRKAHPEHIVAQEYNKVMICRYVHKGDYLHALAQCDYMTKKSNQLAMHVKIYAAMKQWDLAFTQQQQLDSLERRLHTEDLTESLEDLNDELKNRVEQEKRASVRQRQLIAVGAMLFLLVLLLLVILLYRRRSHKQLEEQYKLLVQARRDTQNVLTMRQAFVETMAEQLKQPLGVLWTYARMLNVDVCPFTHDERTRVLGEIGDAAKTIDRMIDPVLDSYINKTEGIRAEQRIRCQEVLRSPLHALIGMTEMAVDAMDKISEDDMNAMRKTMSAGAHQVAVATHQLILFSATDEYNLKPKNDILPLNELITSFTGSFDLRNKKTVEMQFQSAVSDNATIMTDHDTITEILFAIYHYMDKYSRGGTINTTCEAEVDGTYTLKVCNHGLRIQDDEVEEAFQPFSLIGDQTTGLGLSLALARRLALVLGYQLSIDTTYTHGTCLVVKGM